MDKYSKKSLWAVDMFLISGGFCEILCRRLTSNWNDWMKFYRLSLSLLSLSLISFEAESRTIKQPEIYPKFALENCIQGYVILSYSFTEERRFADIQILESEPEGVFDEAAIESLGLRIARSTEPHHNTGQKVVFELDENICQINKTPPNE